MIKMSWTIFYSLIFCSIFNWGSIMTHYNLQKTNIDWNYLLYNLPGNEQIIINHCINRSIEIPQSIQHTVKYHKQLPSMSKQLYYQNITLQ